MKIYPPHQKVYTAITIVFLLVTQSGFSQPGETALTNKEGSRQVHLDFHTSEEIKDIGKRFSKEQFQQTLRTGGINSINIFAKGHHGWTYYPSKVGEQHPNLEFDL